MTIHPIPTESEKKACPTAVNIVSGENASLKSGDKRNLYPAAAFGINATRMAIIIRMINNAGIITFEAFSIPLTTPRMMMRCVSKMNIMVYIAWRGDA